MKTEEGETTIDSTYFYQLKNKYNESCSGSSFLRSIATAALHFRQGIHNR